AAWRTADDSGRLDFHPEKDAAGSRGPGRQRSRTAKLPCWELVDALAPAGAVRDPDRLGLVLAEDGGIDLIGLERAPARDDGGGRDAAADRVFVVAFGEDLLGFGRHEEFQQLDRVLAVRRIFRHARPADVHMRAAAVLI